MNARHFAENPSEQGHWAERPSAAQEDSPAPLAWLPRPPFCRRIAGAITVPVVVGIAVFLLVVVATAWTLLRGLAGEAAQQEHSRESGSSSNSSSTQSPGDDSFALLDPSGNDAPGDGGVDGAAAGGNAAGAQAVLVHVVGEVQSPGVVEVPAGSRVAEAIAAAGGATDAAVLSGVNLARPLVDGEQIVVPDAAAAEELRAGQASAGSAGAGQAGAGQAGTGGPPAVVNLNTATASELEELPRVGPATAERIIAWREQNGAFSSVDQLLEVSGIGAKTLEALRDRVGV